ncbi:SMI1/KNR4 family protein [Pseudosporangium ferrugineum]|uniref:SUKH superfamily protein n=1 Tax=Pseudosporangium ferrugineum TaxID=439699 RepID=A0A2T0SHV8_9ACTN|nr:SMI1/KNR4 family protein [Pseudosporangium ferrugineum]PRY32989.1 SUKH superfamily protein [Pseudosporangium ferrugineum]
MLAVFWRDIVLAVLPSATLSDGAAPGAVAAAQERLGQLFPEDLASLLAETDGVRGAWGLDAVWPVERIVRDNVEFRTFPDFKDLYAPFDDLLFFGDNGGGDHFGFVPGDPSRGVVVWDHETDERRTVADGLADYLTRVLPSGGDEWYHPSA